MGRSVSERSGSATPIEAGERVAVVAPAAAQLSERPVSAAGGAGAAGAAPKRSQPRATAAADWVEQQQVYVYCQSPDGVRDVEDICALTQSPRLSPQQVEPQAPGPDATWKDPLRLHVKRPPPPYSQGDWAGFLLDINALLTASLGSLRCRSDKPARTGAGTPAGVTKSRAARWPALFVTDRTELHRASVDASLRAMLVETTGLKECHWLPVVLAEDFGEISGVLVKGTPLPLLQSLSLSGITPPAAAPQGERSISVDVGEKSSPSKAEVSFASEVTVDPPATLDVHVGVYMQHGGATSASQLQEEGASGCFGYRCLALFANGQCAYAAVSPDGVRRVDAGGTWQLANGHIVIGGSGGTAVVQHLRCSRSGMEVLDNVSYPEAIHISVEELRSAFEAPLPLSACLPDATERMKMRTKRRPQEFVDEFDSHTRRVSGLDATFDSGLNGTWGSSQPIPPAEDEVLTRLPSRVQTPHQAYGTDMPVEQESAVKLGATTNQKTPIHALKKLMSLQEEGVSTVPVSRQMPPAEPRLYGLNRGITSTFQGQLSEPLAHTYQHVGLRRDAVAAALCDLVEFAELSAHQDVGKVFKSSTCALKPGLYAYRSNQPEPLGSELAITLHADGRCKYREVRGGNVAKSVPAGARWQVDNDLLVLEAQEPGSYGFFFREQRGNRSVERRVSRVELPLKLLLARSTYTPFAQQSEPFPDHVPAETERCIFGTVDPDSPALLEITCRTDQIPFHAFERELRRHDMGCDEIVSDFKFIDRDEDGQLSVNDMRSLETYGLPVAAPELMHQLREALVDKFDTLVDTWTKMSGQPPHQGEVSLETFEAFLQKEGDIALDATPSGKGKKLQAWMASTTAEEREAVFASMRLDSERPVIECQDLLSLSLHTAVCAMHRLEHFQTWVFEEFGRTQEVFSEVFNALDNQRQKVLTRRDFVEGAQRLGYPCGQDVTNSLFALLDRNLDGKVAPRDFQRLREFNGDQLLVGLRELKRFAQEKFGGLDEAFIRLQDVERRDLGQVGGASRPKAIRFETFKRTISKAGFAKAVPDADLTEIFLFLTEATSTRSSGLLSRGEWGLLKGFDSRALTGNPARLRRILDEQYGGLDEAFARMHASWLKRALVKGLRHLALAGLSSAINAAASQREEGDKAGAARGRPPRQGSRRVPQPSRPISRTMSSPDGGKNDMGNRLSSRQESKMLAGLHDPLAGHVTPSFLGMSRPSSAGAASNAARMKRNLPVINVRSKSPFVRRCGPVSAIDWDMHELPAPAPLTPTP